VTEGASPTDDVSTAAAGDPADNPAEGPAEDSADRSAADRADSATALERECDIAADYLEELLDIADLDGDLDLYVEGERAAVSIVGTGLDDLVGRHGEVLDALQDLTRLAVLRTTGERSRLMLDIGGFRAAKRKSLEEQAREVVAEVEKSGEPQKLSPMTPFERKVVHDAVAAAGLKSESEGEEPHRCVVVLPA
jgi:spoIIIJ-associated protein